MAAFKNVKRTPKTIVVVENGDDDALQNRILEELEKDERSIIKELDEVRAMNDVLKEEINVANMKIATYQQLIREYAGNVDSYKEVIQVKDALIERHEKEINRMSYIINAAKQAPCFFKNQEKIEKLVKFYEDYHGLELNIDYAATTLWIATNGRRITMGYNVIRSFSFEELKDWEKLSSIRRMQEEEEERARKQAADDVVVKEELMIEEMVAKVAKPVIELFHLTKRRLFGKS